MRWKYHMPHQWLTPRTVWEDVYLLPDHPDYSGESFWLTVDALGDASDPTHGSERAAFQKEALEKMGDADFWIDGADMIVRARDFTKAELLDWVKIWLEQQGLPVAELVEAPLPDFAESNEHVKLISALMGAETKPV
jgi:hypothetical protein